MRPGASNLRHRVQRPRRVGAGYLVTGWKGGGLETWGGAQVEDTAVGLSRGRQAETGEAPEAEGRPRD